MPDFIDFNTQLAATGDDERRLLEAALSRARDADAKARVGLQKAGREASGHYDSNGQLVGESALSETASYSDYLSAKGNAVKAWAAAASQDVNPRSIGNVLRQNVGGQGAQAGADLAAKEEQIGADVDRQGASIRARRQADATVAQQKQQQADAAKKIQQEAQQRYLEALVRGAHGRAAGGGTQRDYVGGYNPYASSAWAQSQGGQEAARARAMGASEEQVRNIWNSYTQKGEFGSGSVPGGQNDYMENAIQQWAPKKEED